MQGIQSERANQEVENVQETETSNDEGVDLESQSFSNSREYNQIQTNLDEEDSGNNLVPTPRVAFEEMLCTARHVSQSITSLEEFKKAPDYEFGIENEGNTCFLNAALQCIFSSKEFIHYYQQEKYLKRDQLAYIIDSKYRMKLEGYHFCNTMRKICNLFVNDQVETI